MSYVKLTDEQKEQRKKDRQELKAIEKTYQQIKREKNLPRVKNITITIEWKRSRMWGNNPNATAEIEYKDGSYRSFDHYYASGCGYCKESTVIGQIFNEHLKYKLWNIGYKRIRNGKTIPYGIHAYSKDSRSFGQGIGTSCFDAIARTIKGKFKHIASGKTFDVYKYTDTLTLIS